MPQQNLQCPFCSKTSSHGAGLASHIRGTHPEQHSGRTKSRKGGGKAVAAEIKPAGTAGGFAAIVAGLEQQRNAIVAALAALRAVGGIAEPAVATGKRKRGRPRKIV